jgi:prephenate dehydrogenase
VFQVRTLTVVGVGLIGGSVALAARRRGVAARVVGCGRQPDLLERAQGLGLLDAHTTSLPEAAAEADLVVLCTPVDRIAHDALTAAEHARPGTLLTDVGSTKAAIVAAVDGRLRDGVEFVGSHPLAGSEKRGPENARSDLFERRVTVVTPTPKTDSAAVDRICNFWEALGSRIVRLDPEVHDRALATTSHLPHLVAASLAGMLPEEWRPLAASGFRDSTRVAAGDPDLWVAIFRHNRAAVLTALAALQMRLGDFEHALKTDDPAALHDLLAQAKKVRDALGSGDPPRRP